MRVSLQRGAQGFRKHIEAVFETEMQGSKAF